MSRLLLKWILLAIAVVVASYVAQMLGLGFKVDLDGASKFVQFMIGVAILAFLNATLGRLFKFLTIPLNCMTLGLFSLVINAVVLWIAAGLGFGMSIVGSTWQQFLSAFVASLIISLINGLLNLMLGEDKDKKDRKDD